MSIRILGGVARNFDLATPRVTTTRPTSVLLKRRLFDSIQNFQNIIFIDLCEGSGSIAYEALSRGAEKVYLVEKSKQAFTAMVANQKKIQQKYPELGEVHCFNEEIIKWLKKHLKTFTSNQKEEAFIFFDPPYDSAQLYEEFFNLIKDFEFRGKVVVEACQQKTMSLGDFENRFGKAQKIFRQGTSYFAIYDF